MAPPALENFAQMVTLRGSRRQAVDVAWERGDLPNVGRAGQARDPPLEADRETAVRWHAMAERLEVSLVGGGVLTGERSDVVGVPMEPLPASHELESSEDQVE